MALQMFNLAVGVFSVFVGLFLYLIAGRTKMKGTVRFLGVMLLVEGMYFVLVGINVLPCNALC